MNDRERDDRESAALERVTNALASEVRPEHDRDEVEHAVSDALRHYDGARVREFVPIMVEREARESLRRAS